MEKQEDMAEFGLVGALSDGKPIIVITITQPKLVLSLDEAKALLRTFTACVDTTELGYKRYQEDGETKET